MTTIEIQESLEGERNSEMKFEIPSSEGMTHPMERNPVDFAVKKLLTDLRLETEEGSN